MGEAYKLNASERCQLGTMRDKAASIANSATSNWWVGQNKSGTCHPALQEVARAATALEMQIRSIMDELEEDEDGEWQGRGAASSKCRNEPPPWHPCPFKVEINADSTSLCRCCNDCEYECSRDI